MDSIAHSLRLTLLQMKNRTPLTPRAVNTQTRPDRKWKVSYHTTDDNGRLKLCHKFFRDKAEAKAFCDQKKAEKVSLGNLAFGLSDDLKREALACCSKLKPYGKTLTDAVAYYIKDLETLHRSVSVKQAANELALRVKADGRSARHIQAITQVLALFSKTYGTSIISTIKTAQVQQWLDSYRTKAGKPLSASSFNTFKRYLSLLFSFSIKRGYAETNPVVRVDFKIIKTKLPRLLSPTDLRAILEAAPETVRPALAVQAFCGLRVAEVARLKWTDFLATGFIQVGSSNAKTGKRRLTPVPRACFSYLNSVKQSSGFIFGGDNGGDIYKLSHALTEVRRAVKAVKWENNALRASALSYRLAETKDAAATALEMGNSPTVLLRDYRELTTDRDAQLWFEIDPSEPQKVLSSKPIKFNAAGKKRKAQ
jgi:integrase